MVTVGVAWRRDRYGSITYAGAVATRYPASEEIVILSYLNEALKRAEYTQLEDGSYCAEVRGLRGVIATGKTLETCRATLQEVIEEWVLVRVSRGLDVPSMGRVKIRIRKAG
jgi:predicted RNase H-like HicB family nuclease